MKIEISNGEILDKITILMIKSKKIADPIKLKNINVELDELLPFLDFFGYKTNTTVTDLVKELESINEKIWEIEDDIRSKERVKQFDNDFIELARNVYFTNDKRCEIKKRLNEVTNSTLIEEKNHEVY